MRREFQKQPIRRVLEKKAALEFPTPVTSISKKAMKNP